MAKFTRWRSNMGGTHHCRAAVGERRAWMSLCTPPPAATPRSAAPLPRKPHHNTQGHTNAGSQKLGETEAIESASWALLPLSSRSASCNSYTNRRKTLRTGTDVRMQPAAHDRGLPKINFWENQLLKNLTSSKW